ncbi:MAG: Tetratricopeptide 4 [Frankiales bacterium]|nr:Tetratricopeptide 4 [Frankiales bacterium]
MSGEGLRLLVLGELGAEVQGSAVDLGGRRQKAVLARLVIAHGQLVSADALADAVWGDDPPGNVAGALQSYVSHLRKRLHPDAGARARDAVLASSGPGYCLRLPPDAVDAWEFEHLVKSGSGDAAALQRALDLWRGPALLDYADEHWAQAEVARLDELREVAREALLDARLTAGESSVLIPDLEALLRAEPLREERWRLLVLALYNAGRQADALAALRRARSTLADQLGVDPGPRLRELEQQVLEQSLAVPRQRSAPSAGLTTSVEDLVDRDAELRLLASAVDGASAGSSQVVVVEGPAGIGKSRLLVETRALAQQRGLPVLVARGSQLESAFGFGVVRQLFEPLLLDASRREQLLAGSAASARGVFEEVEQRADGSFAVLHGLYWLTVNLAADGPLVLAVDDLQWCYSGSLRFLAYLARRLDSLPVLLVGTVRTGERHESEDLLAEIYETAGASVRPGPLSHEATEGLVQGRLGSSAAPSFVAACHRTTGGNPLLLRQLLRALEADRVPPDASHADTVMAVGSRAISSMVLMRLRRLPDALTTVARAVAVLGEGAQLPTVAALAGLDEQDAAAALAHLTRAEILRHEHPLGFVHPLVRDAVYRELPGGERELQHQRAAAALLAAGASDEKVAAHLLLAPRRGDQSTVGVLRRAARTVADRGAADSAVTYLRRALEEPVIGAERVDVLLELGLLETHVDGPAGAEHLEQAYPFIDDPAVRGEVALGIARNHIFASPRGVASAFARTARLSLPEELVDVRQGLLALERVAAGMHGLNQDEWLVGSPEVVGHRHGAKMLAAELSWEETLRGEDRARAIALARRATEDDRLFAVDNGLLWVVAANTRMVADDELGDFWQRGQAVAHRQGSLFAALAINLWRGFHVWRLGDLPEAFALMTAAGEQQLMWQQHRGVGTAYADGLRTMVMLERGDVAAAREVLGPALAEPFMGEGQRLVEDAHVAVLVAEQRYAEALAAFEAIVDANHIANPAWRPWRSLKASALVGLGRYDEADALVAEELVLARRWGAPFALGRALRVLGELRQDTALLRESLAVLEPTPFRVELARSQCSVGRATGDEQLLRAALVGAHGCGALGLRDEVLRALHDCGSDAELPWDDVPVLTTTQRRILDLTSTGLDVRAVAQQLFLTPGTVQATLEGLK